MVTASGKSRWTSVGDLGQLSLDKLFAHLPDLDLDSIDTVLLGRTQELGLDTYWNLSFLDLELDLDLFQDLVIPEIERMRELQRQFSSLPNDILSPRKYKRNPEAEVVVVLVSLPQALVGQAELV